MLVVRDAGGQAESVLERSDAVLECYANCHGRGRGWDGAQVGSEACPRSGLRVVARLRYRIWGRLESCPVPTAEERARFL